MGRGLAFCWVSVLFLFYLDKMTRAALILRSDCPILLMSGVGDRQQATAMKGETMNGTLKMTEGGSHTWAKGITIDRAIERFRKLGTVTRRGNKLTVTRFDGSKIKAEFFLPCK